MADKSGFEIDLRGFHRAVHSTAAEIEKASRKGLTAAMWEWKRDAIDVAPLDKGGLRKSISTKIVRAGADEASLDGEIRANAVEKRGGSRFNYGYYIHEVKPNQNFKTPNTVGKFLTTPLEQNGAEYIRIMEDTIREGINQAWK